MVHSEVDTSIKAWKMKAIVWASIVALCLASSPIFADGDQFQIVSILGGQDRTCSQWIEHRKAGGNAADGDKAWLLGFFSGYNTFAPGPRGFFFDYDEPALLAVIDRLCAEDPTIPIAEAAVRFLNHLKQ